MLKEVKYRICSVKCIVILSVLLLIAVCAYAQAPEWQWATNVGGTDWDFGNGIATDNGGNVYITGNFQGTAAFGPYFLTSTGETDIYMAKLDINRNWVWIQKAGGFDNDSGSDIVIDRSNNIYITGYFEGIATFGSFSLTSSGESDVFIAKIDTSGNWLWAKRAGGNIHVKGHRLTPDDMGNCYVTGCFEGSVNFGSYSLTSSGSEDVFVAKIDADGNWQWATGAGGSDWDYGLGIEVDDTGNSYVTGCFQDVATFGPFTITSNDSLDIFVAKLNTSGCWEWVTKAGGIYEDYGFDIVVDESCDSYVIGFFQDVASFGTHSLVSSGITDIFVAKIDSSGNWSWIRKAGGANSDLGIKIIRDNIGNLITTGCFSEQANFGSHSITSSGSQDVFVANMDRDGNWLWVANGGGDSTDIGWGIQIDIAGNIYVTGFFSNTMTFGYYNITSNGGPDIFVAKLTPPVSADPEINSDADILSNYPNPFDQRTVINYALRRETEVSLEVYNIKGQLVETLFEGTQQPGDHTIEWDCVDMPSGMYFFKMKTGDEECIRKMILLR